LHRVILQPQRLHQLTPEGAQLFRIAKDVTLSAVSCMQLLAVTLLNTGEAALM
jgi:hypothetical protein